MSATNHRVLPLSSPATQLWNGITNKAARKTAADLNGSATNAFGSKPDSEEVWSHPVVQSYVYNAKTNKNLRRFF
jgi:hypothetical protein